MCMKFSNSVLAAEQKQRFSLCKAELTEFLICHQ